MSDRPADFEERVTRFMRAHLERFGKSVPRGVAEAAVALGIESKRTGIKVTAREAVEAIKLVQKMRNHR